MWRRSAIGLENLPFNHAMWVLAPSAQLIFQVRSGETNFDAEAVGGSGGAQCFEQNTLDTTVRSEWTFRRHQRQEAHTPYHKCTQDEAR